MIYYVDDRMANSINGGIVEGLRELLNRAYVAILLKILDDPCTEKRGRRNRHEREECCDLSRKIREHDGNIWSITVTVEAT